MGCTVKCRIKELTDRADSYDTKPWSISGLRQVHCAFLAIYKNSPPIVLSGQRAEETFPKTATYCHLLPLSMVERFESPSD
jgi:hypothetical protein